MKSILNEKELLRKVADGDQYAFRVLYDFYYGKIYTFSFHLLKSKELAEEITQETFLKFWMRGYQANKIANLEAFLVTVTRNLALDILRRAKLEVSVNLERRKDWLEYHNETEESIMLDDTRRVLQNAIEKLPPQQKLVYKLCYQDGLNYKETAEKLNLSNLTVQSYMKLALRNIRKFVSENTDIPASLIIVIISIVSKS